MQSGRFRALEIHEQWIIVNRASSVVEPSSFTISYRTVFGLFALDHSKRSLFTNWFSERISTITRFRHLRNRQQNITNSFCWLTPRKTFQHKTNHWITQIICFTHSISQEPSSTLDSPCINKRTNKQWLTPPSIRSCIRTEEQPSR